VRHYDFDYVLIGGGAASVAAARALRRENSRVTIAMLCAEGTLPYQRPPLTKDFLAGTLDALQLALHPLEFHEEQRIELVTGARAVDVNPSTRTVTVSDGRVFRYGKGATPQRLGVPGDGLAGIRFMHDVGDAATRHAA
jgi:NAD(P)H-nitrite reductase large subunit